MIMDMNGDLVAIGFGAMPSGSFPGEVNEAAVQQDAGGPIEIIQLYGSNTGGSVAVGGNVDD